MSHKGALIHNKGSHQAKHPIATRCLYSADPVGSPTRGLLYIIIYYRGVAYSRPIRSSALARECCALPLARKLSGSKRQGFPTSYQQRTCRRRRLADLYAMGSWQLLHNGIGG